MRTGDEAAWPSTTTTNPAPTWYVEGAFRNALRRVVCVLNRRAPRDACKGIRLERSDEALAASFAKAGLDAKLIQFNVEDYDAFAKSDEHSAEHHFYAKVRFEERAGARVAVFKVPRAFLDWGYQNLRRPAADDLLEADFSDGPTSPAYVTHCATNYLVKNFWHNFVHNELQGITHENYGRFRGIAREASDFEADHVANLLTLLSYGVKPMALGRGASDTTHRIEAIFTRNRCNQVFAKRARHREDEGAAGEDAQWSELEWRFCRSVANRVSTALLAHHLAVPSVEVYLGGDARSSPQRGTRWRHGDVIVDIGGRRMATPLAAYVPDDEIRARRAGGQVTVERQGRIRRFRAGREADIASWVRHEYAKQLSADEGLRDGVKLALQSLGARIGTPLI